jgi:hypothetical protein
MPHHCFQPKGWMSKKRLKYHLFGLYNHGEGQVTLFPHFEHWPHTANLNISFLFCYLRKLKEQGKLGRNLMLQFDNCWRDNKNRWLFGFISHLIELGWFDRVEIYFLKPGHSHDMVDALCFAPLGKKARETYTFWTPDEFLTFIDKAFAHRKKPLILDPVVVWDWHEWLSPSLRNISQHSFQRAFLFQKQNPLGSVMLYKKHLLKTEWLGRGNALGTGMVLFNQNPLRGEPLVLAPSLIPDEDIVDVPTLSAMPVIHRNFWNSFLEGNQFEQGAWTQLPDSWVNDFWGIELYSSSSSFDISSLSEETDEERVVRVAHQPTFATIPTEELHPGSIIAVRPDQSYYDENPEETIAPFWIAKIKGKSLS